MNGGKTKLWERIQSYIIVTMITALVWLYAESENVTQQKPLPFNIQFQAPPGQNLAISPSTPQQVRVIVRCATGQYTRLLQLQSQPIPLTVEANSANPVQVLNIDSRLEDSPIGQLGVEFVDVQPDTITLRVERLVDVTLPVVPTWSKPNEAQLTGPPIPQPSQATIRLPQSIIAELGDSKLEAMLDPDAVNRLPENVRQELTVPIGAPESLRQKLAEIGMALPPISPPTTKVSLTVRKTTDTFTATSLPILVVAPWLEMDRFSVKLENNRRVLDDAIQVSGPSNTIEKIRQGQIKIWAELRLSADDLESGITSKQLYINVPPDVQIDSTIPLLNFTITARNGKPSPPGTGIGTGDGAPAAP